MFMVLTFTYCGSDTIDPVTLSNPRLWAAIAAAAIVFTLLGARGHNSRTGPTTQNYCCYWTKTGSGQDLCYSTNVDIRKLLH